MLNRLVFLCVVATTLGCNAKIDGGDFAVEQIADGVYVHLGQHKQIDFDNKGDIANIGFIVGEKSVAVIDTGGSRYIGEALLNKIKQVTDLPVSHVILTHTHPDHIFGVSAFSLLVPKVDVVGHKNLTNSMIQRGEIYRDRFVKESGFEPEDLQLVTQTVFIESEQELDLGGRKLSLIAFGTAHTNSDLSVFDNKTQTYWAGDLMFRERVPVVDGSAIKWLKVIEKIIATEVQHIVPGHGKVASAWQQGFENQMRYLNKLVVQSRETLLQNVPIQDAVKTVAIDEAKHWLLFEDHHQQNVSRTYAELEWE